MHVTFVSDSDAIWSRIGAATFNHLFPDLATRICFLSSDVIEGEKASVFHLMTGWGILGNQNQKVNTDNFLESIINSRLVIVSSAEFVPYVLAICPSASIEVCSVLSEKYTLSGDEFENLSAKEQGVRVAKMLHEFYKVAAKMTGTTRKNKIIAFTPVRSIDGDMALARAQFEASINQGLVISTDFRAKGFQPVDLDEPIIEFDPTDLTASDFVSLPIGSVLFPSREFSRPENILLSTSWFNFITQMSRFQYINLITAPKYSAGEKFSDSYLASGVAGVVYIVGTS